MDFTESGKRYPSAYFRVGFFGSPFDELNLNGTEFIYKMMPLTRLPQICEHLQTLFGKRFGTVELLADSKEVDPSQLEPGRAYLQVCLGLW